MVPPPVSVRPISLLSIFIILIVVMVVGLLTGYICWCRMYEYACNCNTQKTGESFALVIILIIWILLRIVKNTILFLWLTIRKIIRK